MFRKTRRESTARPAANSVTSTRFTDFAVLPEPADEEAGAFSVGTKGGEKRGFFGRFFGRRRSEGSDSDKQREKELKTEAPTEPAVSDEQSLPKMKRSLWARSKSILRGNGPRDAELDRTQSTSIELKSRGIAKKKQLFRIVGGGPETVLVIEGGSFDLEAENVVTDADGLLAQIFAHNHEKYLELCQRQCPESSRLSVVETEQAKDCPPESFSESAGNTLEAAIAETLVLDSSSEQDSVRTEETDCELEPELELELELELETGSTASTQSCVEIEQHSLDTIAELFGLLNVKGPEVKADGSLRYLVPKDGEEEEDSSADSPNGSLDSAVSLESIHFYNTLKEPTKKHAVSADDASFHQLQERLAVPRSHQSVADLHSVFRKEMSGAEGTAFSRERSRSLGARVAEMVALFESSRPA